MAANNSDRRDWGVIIRGISEFMVFLAVLLLIVLLIVGAWLRIEDLREKDEAVAPTGDASADVQNALDKVNSTADNFERLLSLLEGAGVLVGLALGAAAFYGLRNSRETREDLRDELDELDRFRANLTAELNTQREGANKLLAVVEDQQERVEKMLGDFAVYQPTLNTLPDTIAELSQTRTEIDKNLFKLLQIVTDLQRASQELILKNYREAYAAVQRVLERDPTNLQALYMAGWLEFEYVDEKLDDGIKHLEKALEQEPGWPSALAAYGVLLRRKGLRSRNPDEKAMYLAQAEGYLRQALKANRGLIDLNLESFWGPLGGILRDTGQFEKAITAYENACDVTPGSSYPHGNLAALYLKKVQTGDMTETTALDAFRQTRQLAQVELARVPNDYFLIMDLAMASAILGHEQEEAFNTAQEWLDRALRHPGVTAEMLNVSIRGWGYLRDYCPKEWDPVLDFIYRAIQRLEDEQTARLAAQEDANLL